LFDEVLDHLDHRAVEHGLVVVLDDLHWADGDSVGLLEFAVRQLTGRRLLMVGTYRDVEAGDRLRRVAGGAQVIRLDGLAAPEVGRLMAEVAAEAIPDDVAARMHARTGGNPLFVRELTRLVHTRRTADTTCGRAQRWWSRSAT
jgi:predicted ATPase